MGGGGKPRRKLISPSEHSLHLLSCEMLFQTKMEIPLIQILSFNINLLNKIGPSNIEKNIYSFSALLTHTDVYTGECPLSTLRPVNKYKTTIMPKKVFSPVHMDKFALLFSLLICNSYLLSAKVILL